MLDILQNVCRGTCLFFLLAASGCAPVGERPELILFNGQIGLGGGTARPSAIALGGGRVLALGTDREILAPAGPGTRQIDLEGAWVGPAFADHHIHLLNMGLSIVNRQQEGALYADLTQAASLEELVQILEARGQSQPPGSWILGKGWSQAVWGESGLPTHEILSRNFPANPVFLTRVDGHAGWVNREALDRAEIDRNTADPPGGKIVRLADGEPSGALLERANEAIVSQLPGLPDEVIRAAFRAASQALAARGATRVFDAGFLAPPGVVALNIDFDRILRLLVSEDNDEPLPIEINLMIPAPSPLALDVLSLDQEARRFSDRIRVTHLKLFADGAMGSRGAALSHPFADQGNSRGVPRMSGDEIKSWTILGLDSGLDVATHAIGDASLHQALTAYQEVLEQRPGTLAGRLRIEHFSYASQKDIERAAEMGIVLSIQPNFVYPDDNGQTMEDARVGPQNSGRVYAWGTLHRLGARLAGGSDFFGLPGPALETFYSGLTRANPAGLPIGGWHPHERLDRETALELMWWRHPPGGAAVEARLNPGTRADLVLLSDNPITASQSALREIRVLAVLKEGEVIFSDGSRTARGRLPAGYPFPWPSRLTRN